MFVKIKDNHKNYLNQIYFLFCHTKKSKNFIIAVNDTHSF